VPFSFEVLSKGAKTDRLTHDAPRSKRGPQEA
jgi:hypothetical protein